MAAFKFVILPKEDVMEDNNILLNKVAKLPAGLKSKVYEFIDFLLTTKSENEGEINKPVFGSGKGMFIMKPGFDDPIEDFKEYM